LSGSAEKKQDLIKNLKKQICEEKRKKEYLNLQKNYCMPRNKTWRTNSTSS
jgi:hypothetical protein